MSRQYPIPPFFRQSAPTILQTEAAECGLACLAMVTSYHGFKVDLAGLRRRWSISLKGMNLRQLMTMAQHMNLSTRALRCEPEDLVQLKTPAILHWNLDHFVVLEHVSRKKVRVIDPALGRKELTLEDVSRHFTGVALEVTPTGSFQRSREASRLPIMAFFHHTRGLPGALIRILALSLALQGFVLLAPLFSQIVIDEIVITGDRALLMVLGAAFLLLAAIRLCIAGIRGWLVITLGASLQFGWSARLFHHLLRLPLGWYEKRHTGDIMSRFGSIRAVEGLVANTVVESIIDGMMAITTLTVMFLYSSELVAVAMIAVTSYALLRVLLYRPLRNSSYESLLYGARESTTFMESVRAILPLKNFCREALREATWQNQKVEALNADVRVSRLHLIQQIANTGIFAFENIAVLWIGALSIMDNNLTAGMLVAFISYKNQFGTRTTALIDKLFQFRLISVHLDRIADIALADRDPGTIEATMESCISGEIELKNVSYRHADTEPLVIDRFSLQIEQGECVAITAPSGAGKTTLLKLMMGLLPPADGEIRVDGMDIRRYGIGTYRRNIAAVMQDDVLLAGTLEENVAAFDPKPDRPRLVHCARIASIEYDIERMPMGWSTLVGDLGSTLSGGQRQRILLARALYISPRILFLDEATSHLDMETERHIHTALKSMQITRILVTHRKETLTIVDRVVELPQ